ncbi:hypothetical protein TKK_0001568 [Trichogramma kaykai]
MKLFVSSIFLCFLSVAHGDVMSDFKTHEIVPDVLKEAPAQLLSVNYKGIEVKVGDELTPTQVKDTPTLKWNAEESSFYTISMIDPDAPSRRNATLREFLHWIVVNVPGSGLDMGDTLAAYVGAGAPKGTGLHRYVQLIYKQPGKIDVSGIPKIPNNSRNGRPNFSIQKFAELHNLGNPIAGNMFQAQFDDYVPILSQQLSSGGM